MKYRLTSPNWLYVFLFGIAAIYWLHEGILRFALLGAVLSLMAVFSGKYVEIAADKRSYRLGMYLGGLRLGGWDTLPPVQRVVVRYFSNFVTSGRPGRMITQQNPYYLIMLSVAETEGLIIHRAADKDSAIKLADKLAEVLEVETVLFDVPNS